LKKHQIAPPTIAQSMAAEVRDLTIDQDLLNEEKKAFEEQFSTPIPDKK
jgi:hypothetical protein